MEEDYIKRKKETKQIYTFIVIPILLFITFQIICFKFYSKYTICTTINKVKGGYRGNKISYYFLYKNRKIINEDDIRKKTKYPNYRYIVQFSTIFPSYFCDIYQEYSIPDSIKSAPPEGWDKIPDWVIPVYHGD